MLLSTFLCILFLKFFLIFNSKDECFRELPFAQHYMKILPINNEWFHLFMSVHKEHYDNCLGVKIQIREDDTKTYYRGRYNANSGVCIKLNKKPSGTSDIFHDTIERYIIVSSAFGNRIFLAIEERKENLFCFFSF